MKALKIILIVLLILVVGGAAVVFFYPSEYNVSRSKLIEVPVSKVYNTVNDLKTYEKWGPWHEEDSTIVVTYGEKTVGVGAQQTWTSKEGPGKMWITEAEPHTLIKQKIQFRDYDPSEIMWTFEEIDGSTKVTWTMSETNSPFFFKMYAVVSGGWEGIFGPMLESGLENLDKLSSQEHQNETSFSFSDPKVIEFEGGTFVGYKNKTKIDQKAMLEVFQRDLPKTASQVMKSGYTHQDFLPGALYFSWDEQNQETEFLVGVMLTDVEKLNINEMDIFAIEPTKAVMSSKFGNYGNGDNEAHVAINEYITQNELDLKLPIFELYVNEPEQVEPQEIQTDIYYPIQN